jgi:ligand-binding sensor domain-containing protein
LGQDLPPFPLSGLTVRVGIGTPELWIATDGGGVLIFDGQTMRSLVPEDSRLRKISALVPLSSGRVVVGTENAGAYLANGKHLRLLHPQFSRLAVTALAGDEDALWLGTRNDGVWLWQGGEAVHFLPELPDHQVLSLYASRDAAWAGTPLGVAEFSHAHFQRRLADGVFAQSLLEKNGTLYVGTMDEGVLPIPLAAGPSHMARSVEAEDPSSASPSILSLAQVGDEVLAVSPSSVVRVPSGAKVVSPEPQALTDTHITALHLDNRGRLWIGYFDHGLDIVRLGTAQPAEHFETDLLFCINRIKEDAGNRTVTVATANGLAIFDSSTQIREALNRKSGLLADHVTDFIYDTSRPHHRSLLIATPAGISFVEDGNISGISGFQGLVNNHVYTLAVWNDSLFAGTLGGFSILRKGTVEQSYTTANSSLRQNWITSSVAIGDDLYLGTYGSGVVRIDLHLAIKTFPAFEHTRVEVNPNALLATDTAIYAGTAGQGLAVLCRGEDRWRWVRAGLPSYNVTALASGNEAIYVGTDNGLVSARERDLTR